MKNRRIHFWTLLPAALVMALPAGAVERSFFAAAPIQKQVEYLASDALRGRGSGDRGNEAAARYIAAEFERYGVKPLGTMKQRDPYALMDRSGYYQPFHFVSGRLVGKGNRLEAALNGKNVRYRMRQEFEPSSVSGAGRAESEVVFVGYGIRAPGEKHDDYAGVDVKGKSVLLISGSPKNDPHSPLYAFSSIYRKAMTARELGAQAVFVALGRDSDAQGFPPSDFDDVNDTGLPVMRVRYAVAAAWLKAAGKDIAAALKEADASKSVSAPLGVNIRLVADVQKVEKATANIAGLIEGSDPVLKKEFVVIGAHMDHLGMGGTGSLDRSGKPAIHHGADDNASGTAGILQLARYFGSYPEGTRAAAQDAQSDRPRPRRSVVLICFSGEERGLLGSMHYVNNPLVPLGHTVAMLNMDMIGRLRNNRLMVIGSGTAKEWDGLLNEANKTAGFELARSQEGFGASDQQSFYLKRIPVLFFFTGSHAEYHTPKDTADTVNAEGIARIIGMVADCALRIAEMPTAPAFQKMQETQTALRGGFRVSLGTIPNYGGTVEGVLLDGVREGGPAAKAGMKAGDILIKFGDKTLKNVQDYTVALQDYRPGDVVDVVVKRGAETLTLKVTLAGPRG